MKDTQKSVKKNSTEHQKKLKISGLQKSSLASLKMTLLSLDEDLLDELLSLSGLETEPFKNWSNIVYKTMGLASQRTTWRSQIRENFL